MNEVERLRRLREENLKVNEEQKAKLILGFQSEFWKVLKARLEDTFQSCHKELETIESAHRLAQIQGEIAALKILIDWPAVLKVKE